MSDFSDFNELYDPLRLPINGKSYTIPPVSFEAGVRINGVVDGEERIEDEEFFRLILGDTFDEMVTDKAPLAAITRAGQTAVADFKYGRAMAEVMWKTGSDPKAVQALAKAPNRAARRSKVTGAEKKTP